MMAAALCVGGLIAGFLTPFVLAAQCGARVNLLSCLTVAFAAGLAFFTGVS